MSSMEDYLTPDLATYLPRDKPTEELTDIDRWARLRDRYDRVGMGEDAAYAQAQVDQLIAERQQDRDAESRSRLNPEDRPAFRMSENISPELAEIETARMTDIGRQVAEADSLAKRYRAVGMTAEAEAEEAKIRELQDDDEILSEVKGVYNSFMETASAGIVGDESRALDRYIDEKIGRFQTVGDYKNNPEYQRILREERALETEFANDHPVGEFGARAAGSLAPGGAGARLAGTGKTFMSGFARQGTASAVELGIYGFMEGETLDQRIEQAVKFAGLGLTVGGTVGGYFGRRAGIDEVQEAAYVLKQKKDKLQQYGGWDSEGILGPKGKYIEGTARELNKPLSDSSVVIETVEKEMLEAGLAAKAQTGEALTGYDYGMALKEALRVTGISAKRLRHAEAEVGRDIINFRNQTYKDLAERNSLLASEAGFYNGVYVPSVFTGYITKLLSKITSEQNINNLDKVVNEGLRSTVTQGKMWVSEKFGGALQRVSTQIARRSAITDAELKTDPIMRFQAATKNDYNVKRLILNMSQINKKNPDANVIERRKYYAELIKHLDDQYDPVVRQGFLDMLAVITRKSAERRRFIDRDVPEDGFYWPSLFDEKKIKLSSSASGPSPVSKQTANVDQKRNFIEPNDPLRTLPNYENPTNAAASEMRRWDSQIAAVQALNLANFATWRGDILRQIDEAPTATARKKAQEQLKDFETAVENNSALYHIMENTIAYQGGGNDAKRNARNLLISVVDNGSRGPNAFLSFMRQLSYMGTIGNPYSAVLNFGDIANSAVNFGAENTARAIVDRMRRSGANVTTADIGLANQATGEFLRETPQLVGDRFGDLMRRTVMPAMDKLAYSASGFRFGDQFGKNVSMNAAIYKGRKDIVNGTFDRQWQDGFTPTELRQLKADLLANRKSMLVEDFGAFNLAKLQPSDLAQMPKFYLDHPNVRVLYMLKTFAIKQLSQVNRLVVKEWEQGNKAEAVKNALAYSTIVGGSNAFLLESRQMLKGQAPDYSFSNMVGGVDENGDFNIGRWMDWAAGIGSVNFANKYVLERMAEGQEGAAVAGMAPPFVGMIFAPAVDIIRLGATDQSMEELLTNSNSLGMVSWGRLVQQIAKEREKEEEKRRKEYGG